MLRGGIDAHVYNKGGRKNSLEQSRPRGFL